MCLALKHESECHRPSQGRAGLMAPVHQVHCSACLLVAGLVVFNSHPCLQLPVEEQCIEEGEALPHLRQQCPVCVHTTTLR